MPELTVDALRKGSEDGRGAVRESERDISPLILSFIPGLGPKTIAALLSGQDRAISARQLISMPEGELRLHCALAFPDSARADRAAEMLLDGRSSEAVSRRARETVQRCAEAGIRWCGFGEKDYPRRLCGIPDPPGVLYYAGKLPRQDRPVAAVVGTRRMTPYGRMEARRFAEELAGSGVQVVSGMARGVDSEAGRAALCPAGPVGQAGGASSFAVLGCGPDICYPPESRDLYDELRQRGGLISEYPPGTRPEARLFPPRNRIISGLSDVVLVIEAREKSGTMITVDAALEQGREVYAVPGRISDISSAGCNRLIQQGAGIALSPEQFLHAAFGIGEGPGAAPAQCLETAALPAGLSRLQSAVFGALRRDEARTEEAILGDASASLGRAVSWHELVSTLTILQARGLAQEYGLGAYVRN